jgi:hypothetical protein
VKALAILSLLAGLTVFPAFADCVAPPPAPNVPNGAIASRDDMLAAQKAVKAYDVTVQVYLDCAAKPGRNPVDRDKALHTLREVADRFNEELRMFKEKNAA